MPSYDRPPLVHTITSTHQVYGYRLLHQIDFCQQHLSAVQLSSALADLFNLSLDHCIIVPACFKTSVIITVPERA